MNRQLKVAELKRHSEWITPRAFDRSVLAQQTLFDPALAAEILELFLAQLTRLEAASWADLEMAFEMHTLKGAAAVVYRNQVHIYAAPVTTVPITVFVTGPAVAPGPYAGLGSDSVVAFLQRAGGIDPNLGSYRNITVLRNNQPVAHIDLYEFLRTGHMPAVSLHMNDTIVIGQQGPVVAVTGVARAPFTFELAGPSGRGEEISAANTAQRCSGWSVVPPRDST